VLSHSLACVAKNRHAKCARQSKLDVDRVAATDYGIAFSTLVGSTLCRILPVLMGISSFSFGFEKIGLRVRSIFSLCG
jgi:hypothetical protein